MSSSSHIRASENDIYGLYFRLADSGVETPITPMTLVASILTSYTSFVFRRHIGLAAGTFMNPKAEKSISGLRLLGTVMIRGCMEMVDGGATSVASKQDKNSTRSVRSATYER
jgi:hypothetical protein